MEESILGLSSSVEQLERTSSHSHHHHHQHSTRQQSDSSSGGGGYSMSGASTPSTTATTTTTTRRTRHRVDAGEPRGCFTSTYTNNPPPPTLSQLHHLQHHQSSSLVPLGNSSSGSGRLIPVPVPQSLDYFTPMKMLTDFSVIHEVNNAAAAAAAAAVHNNNNNNNTTNNHQQHHHQQQKLLLREMLQKSQQRNAQAQIKSDYEENIEIELNKIQSKPSQQFLKSQVNGCKKRKLYQPVRNQDSNSPAFLDQNSNGDVITTTTSSGNGLVMTTEQESSPEDLNSSEGFSNGGPTMKGQENNYPRKREIQEGDLPTSLAMGNNLAKSHPNLHSNLLHSTPPFLQQWKDTFKSTLVSHISDLIDIQFNLLFSTPNTPPHPGPGSGSLNPNLPNLHHNLPNALQQHEHNTPAHLMNGGGSNLSTKNHSSSPPSRYHHSRYNPMPVVVAPPPQPHFSSALLALSQNYKNVLGDGVRDGGLRTGDRNNSGMLGGSGNSDEYCEDSPLSLVMTPKKKRHKVTDTRLTPRAVSRLLDTPSYQNSSPPPNSASLHNNNNNSTPSSASNFIIQQPSSELATSVAITNPSLNESRHLFPTFNNSGPYNGIIRMMDSPPDFLHQQRASSVHTTGGSDSETGSFDGTGLGGNGSFGGQGMGGGSSSTLTPMHLRKAKLMFFWVRYPSSAVLKMYFPDIKFNKNNTAQLVKWFSNFREFYYIQMEKYARTGLSDGIKNAEDLHVSCESELYRVLNLHYNRNNHIEVPSSFRYVVEQTLREFFKAIQSGKDSEQSWKKAIYKIIARLDDPVPDYFKSPNFLEQLE